MPTKQFDTIKERERQERGIKEEQARLRRRNPSNQLLEMVVVDVHGIHWTADFGERYCGMTTYDGLNKYIADLRVATQTHEQTRPDKL